ncbi:ATP phosphoribosyltransferase regulatory subunit [Campylobacter sp. RM9344]|uniref:ATP phosphoribosyltransferase regulatory subunit n=1 Tax=Campylobacter californiensis TaxID=1032243 RepID=A0AAW3ZSS6_9BACT|nr:MULTISPECIES: ATP phosphoribosyltransferase regulatory subunit [unclassified Campylobacter]MBE2984130.1 ATP phosphoribosyltransferase regulatory subunit [Campylobacter sp. RM6883]MBE2986246.1 ATP phosphoribosyltransferase regulatory subunit [Campylobacter sp. RM12919]MBE2988243.1 ATP phosphoribosyltransferase regulatory subunit [Campylobacter sp. RM12920]MBE2995792.1 ATP phosphoribosyltransferase regulatory subunit [Campylobacter sp. RM6913]MBE3021903.1 ATP phosphoribosyltransferase regulat
MRENTQNLNVYEHEIPIGSRLYFGKSAKVKREIEQKASEILTDEGFSEMVTPFFSYHQHLSVNATQLLRFSDHANHQISLRADSTVDVVRIALRRLKSDKGKKWFYIQPVFRYPSSEIYQIGAELIGESDLSISLKIVAKLLGELGLKPVLQVSNIEIPHTICEILNLSIDVFERGQIEQILAQDVDWLNRLALLKSPEEIDEVSKIVPKELVKPLTNLKELAKASEYENLRIVPLYYSKMRYYDKLFFRFLSQNSILAGGGNYEIDGAQSSGFAVYTDALIEQLID